MKQSLNHSPGAKPLYAQLYEILLNKLHSGEYQKDSILPTEAEFQEIFGVSRITARRALAELVNKGYLKRERGIGTLVIRNSEQQSINVRMKLIGGDGEKIERKNISLEPCIPPSKVLETFNLYQDCKIQCLTRVICREQILTQVNYIYLSPNLGHLELNDFNDGLYVAFENRGQNIYSYKDFITSEMPSQEDCMNLLIKDTTPLLVRTRIGYNDKNEPVEYSIGKHISQYYQYIVEGM
ncbi:GntR family transcriptional regulator [Aliivibrio fischeri]|uniref:GntR family transcriptional regulator n=1 Tax=Aliivibrio fischeri SR5 TaxID=1088719 RepID=A0AAV3EPN1_ALIFS|nr:GntR family transcriptional regulator [Aliivibrio fischeri]EHN68751.1 GntR family transcriptional regulator [Aliivibrio fischeri SR5]